MNKKAFIVIGLGFGDEGKGLTTDYLCSKHNNSIVVRFNGGQQAGHTVTTKNGIQHSFSNFGSGTFRNIPTYWSSFCTFSPAYFLEERNILQQHSAFFLDRRCPVTTHYDVLYNRVIETSRDKNRFGSVGVGFGATIDRHHSSKITLHVEDLFQPLVWREKLQLIRNYYGLKIDTETTYKFNMFDHASEDKQLIKYISEIEYLIQKGAIYLVDEKDIFSPDKNFDTYIFEGAQGIMLDNNYGRFPYITKSNTTSKNALEILSRNFEGLDLEIEIFYVTRAYHTRHGSGPFSQQSPLLKLKNNGSETNKDNEYQGIFKTGYLNTDLLNYAIVCDSYYSKALNKNIVVTCLDQIDSENFPIYSNGLVEHISYRNLLDFVNCKFSTARFSFNSCSDYLDEYC